MFNNEIMDKYLNKLKEYSEISIFLAYNANVDSIKYITNEKSILELLNGLDIKTIIKKLEEYPRVIETPEDFLGRLLFSMKTGKPSEVPMKEDENLEKWFQKIKYDEERIGGQAGIVANLLSLLGLKSIIVYTPLLSKKQSEMFVDKENILYPKVENNEIFLKKIRDAYYENHPTKINRIFEYKKDISINLGDEVITTPNNNRFIVSSRPDALRFEIPQTLKDKLPYIGSLIDCAFLSGYQGIKKKYKDGKNAEYYFNSCREDIKYLKEGNENLKVHLEFASIQDYDIRKMILDYIVPNVDCVGMDETEISNILHTLGHDSLSQSIIKNSKIEDVVEGSTILMENFNLDYVQIHTMYYIMFLCKKDNPLTKNTLEDILDLSTIMASTKAKKGTIKSIEDIKYGITVPYNKYGNLLQSIVEDLCNSYENYKIAIKPSRLVDNPVSTVGLGDTISSVAFVGYVNELKKYNYGK